MNVFISNLIVNKFKHILKYVYSGLLCLLINSCSQDRTNIFSKVYHNTTARYNSYFIARETMKEVEKTILQDNKDNYSEILKIYPIPELTTINSISTDLDDVVKKASLPIQRHKNSKWVDDCYILIGKARFYKQDYYSGVESFQYVNGISKDKPTQIDAMIHLLRTYTAMGNTRSAQTTIDFILADTLTKKNTRDFLLAKAEFELKQKQYTSARKSLKEAVKLVKKKELKARVHFILAQLYQLEQKDDPAYKNFQACLNNNPSYEMGFNAKVSLIQVFGKSKDQTEKDINKFFKKLLRDGRNVDFRDKIYYQMAQYEYRQGNYPEAIGLLEKSVSSSTTNQQQKALSFKSLADIYFDTYKNFSNAKVYYDSTIQFLDKKHPEYEKIAVKKEILSELVSNLAIIAREDSLQKLAKMSRPDLEKFIDKLIDEINQKTEEEKKFFKNSTVYNSSESDADLSKALGGAGDWYFYNPAAIGIGRSDFIKKWGNRKSEDNWRRGNKESTSETTESETEKESEKGGGQPGKVMSKADYLKDVPVTEEQMKESHSKIITAKYKLANLYRTKLDNIPKSIQLFEELLSRYPDNIYKIEIYYNLYIMYKDLKDDVYKKYKNILLDKYPETVYAKLISNPNYLKEIKEKDKEIMEIYKSAYNFYSSGDYESSKEEVKKIIRNYPDNPIIDKFSMLKPLIIGRSNEKEKYETALEEFILKFPKSELTDFAKELLKTSKSTVVVKTVEGKDTVSTPSAPMLYKNDFFSTHFFIIVFPENSDKAGDFKNLLNEFHLQNFVLDKLETELLMFDDKRQMLIVKQYENKEKASSYLDRLKADKRISDFLLGTATPLLVSTGNFGLFYSGKDLDGYIKYYNSNYNSNK